MSQLSHPLQQLVAGVRRRARRLTIVYALAWVVGTVVAAVLLVGLADYLLRFQDRGVRVLGLAACLAMLGVVVFRYLVPALRFRPSNLDVAQRLEQRYPELRDRLASTIEFLDQPEDEPQAGSAALRRAVILQTAVDIEGLHPAAAIDRRPVLNCLATAAGICALTLLLVLLDPFSSGLALVRLADPLGTHPWPRINELAFRRPVTRVARGQAFEVELVDRHGPLPADVQIHYRYAGDDAQAGETVEKMQRLGDVMVARKESVSRPFAYRAEGGDDHSMPWTQVEVLEPPKADVLQITMHAPAYTGWPVEPSDRLITALRGTRVEFSGHANKPLVAATLKRDQGPQIAARLSPDGVNFTIDGTSALIVNESEKYWLELRDKDGLAGGMDDRWDIRAVVDTPPVIAIEQPAANVPVTAEAVVPIHVIVTDNLAIKSIGLEYSRSDRSEDGFVPVSLYAGPDKMPATEHPGLIGVGDGDRRVIQYQWKLAPLRLPPGTQIVLRVVASDYQPLVATSDDRRLTVVTPVDLKERLAKRQAFVLSELQRLLKLQQDVRLQTTTLEEQLKQVARLRTQDIDRLQAAELNQRQIARSLVGQGEGLLTLVDGMLGDLRSNRIDSPEMERQLDEIRQELTQLGREPLPAIQRELTAAIKGAQADQPPAPAAQDAPPSTPVDPVVGQALETAGQQQDVVIASLDKLLGHLVQWQNYRQFAQDIAQFKKDEAEVQRQTAELGRQTLTKDFKDLTAQQQTDLRDLSRRQQELARNFDKTQQRMEQMSAQLADSNPLAAQTIADALHAGRQAGVSGQMRTTGQQLEGNRVNDAAESQAAIGKSLDEMLDILSGRREHELSSLVAKLREAERTLAKLHGREEKLAGQATDAAKEPSADARRKTLERLTREQRELQEEAQRFGRQLQRLQAERAAESTASSGEAMGEAGKAGGQGDAASAAEHARSALKDLEEAQQRLAERRQQAEADLAQEQLARIEDALQGLRTQQQNLLDETVRLEKLRGAQGRLTRAQSQSVQNLSLTQTALRSQTDALADKIAGAPVFQLALQNAALDMQRAAELLHELQTGDSVQAAQRAALARFAQLEAALQPNANEDGAGQEGAEPGGQQSKPQPPGGIQSLAEVKLIRLMQADLNERTKALDDATASQTSLSADQQRQFDQLSQEQGRLADLLVKLTKAAPAAPEDDPDRVPDVRKDVTSKQRPPADDPPRDKETP